MPNNIEFQSKICTAKAAPPLLFKAHF